MQRRYITVDVFTDRAFGGNPLGVVLDAGGLSTEQMQAIASEFNYSETTFVLPPADPAHDAQVRIFTVNREIPFAGHPNVGTAFVLATLAAKPPARLLFEEGAGLVPVEIVTEQGKVVSTEFTAPQPLKRMSHVSVEQAAACLSLSAGDVKTDRHPPQIISVGLAFLAVEVASREALRRARPDAAAFAKTFPCDGSDAVYFYTRDVPAGEKPCELQARMFHPGASGLSEDPATGSATAACRGAAGRSRRHQGRRTEIEDRAGRRHGPAEPVADARAQAEWRGRFHPCRRQQREDDGGNVPA